MKIAIVAGNYVEYSVQLAAALAAQGHEARAFLDAGALRRERTARVERLAGAYAETLDLHPPKPWNRWLAAWRLVRRVGAFRPEVIVIHEHPVDSIVLAMERLTGSAPCVLVVHDPAPHSGADAAYFRRRAAAYRRMRAAASALVVHGAYCRGLLEQHVALAGRPVLSTVIGGDLRPEAPPPASGESGRMLMFGRMQAYKGLDVLLGAAQRLHASGEAFHLALAGAGEALDAAKADFAALGCVTIDDRFLSSDDIIAELARCSVVVLPYRDATQSGVASAAFANHRCVVASAVGGLKDVVRDGVNGLLTPPDDPEALAAALRRILHEPGLAERLTAGARETSETELSWSAAAAALAGFLRQVADSPRPRGAGGVKKAARP